MTRTTDIRPVAAELYFLPVQTRVPLKFGTETTTSVTCARARVMVEDRNGKRAEGWGETPLSVQWVWPGKLPYEARHQILKAFTVRLALAWTQMQGQGHPMEIGWDFQEQILRPLLTRFNEEHNGLPEPMPWLAALVCASVLDIATHDAFGQLISKPIYETYGPEFLNRDLSAFLTPADSASVSFSGKYPSEFLVKDPPSLLPAWHLVGGLDPVDAGELSGSEPADGYPVLLQDWIERDGLRCLKVKLRGNDATWDYARLIKVGELAVRGKVEWLTADFNCTVTHPVYVNAMLDQLRDEHPRIYGMLLYVEQPFPYELEEHPIDVHSVAARKPLFLDESAHDWRMIRRGRELGWTGVALKTCKTQTGAILSACWAKAHGMTLMVQDLTNPMLAQIPHLSLAAHTGTIMGVETNSMQFYPEASNAEAEVHPGIYRRRNGVVDLSTIRGPGFGYRADEIKHSLPDSAASFKR
ncbi:MAG TPA: enolase C-terminal domain-like protein [Candidatus Saccharimonadales bacterium]|nr:enolase C-terminal domain-like protein [Candidatus Saccharimonadales bacterium]